MPRGMVLAPGVGEDHRLADDRDQAVGECVIEHGMGGGAATAPTGSCHAAEFFQQVAKPESRVLAAWPPSLNQDGPKAWLAVEAPV